MPLDQAISTFLQSFPGEVLQPTDPAFARARAEAIWNGAITRQPALIVRPTSTEEVVRTIAFVRESGADVTVRGTSRRGNATSDRYSLAGAATALDAATVACAQIR